MRREPIITAAIIVGVLMSIVNWLIVMGFLSWTPEQVTATEQLVATLAPLLIMFVGAWWARSQVTPLSDPRDDDGVELTRPDNSPTLRQQSNTILEG